MPELDGTWVSLACELRPREAQAGGTCIEPFYLTRAFTYEGDRFDAIITNYADPDCTQPIMNFHFAGSLSDRGPSPVAEGARNVDYSLSDRFAIEPRQQAFADQLNAMPEGTCGVDPWQLGVEQDIRDAGCAAFGIAPGEVVIDHDLIYLADELLFFGAKHVDGSAFDSDEARPHQLQIPLARDTRN